MAQSVPGAFKDRSLRHTSFLPTFPWPEFSRRPQLAAREAETRGSEWPFTTWLLVVTGQGSSEWSD